MARLSLISLLSQLLSFAVLATAAYDRPNDLSLASVHAASYGCGTACRAILNGAIKLDRTEIYGNIPFDEEFYATASNFSSSSTPGDLLKVQAYVHTAANSSWSLPGGTTLFRIQYVSVGVNNAPIPVTAFVAFPFAKPVTGLPYKMVGLGHGTVGTHYGCAPSTSYNLYDYNTWIPILLAGYAVVATDYSGLGNNYTKHYWEANSLNANDVIYSVIAAKHAFPAWLSSEWVAIGHSQGGGTAWGVAESAAVAPGASDLTLIGVAALEPGVRVADEVAAGLQGVEAGIASPAALAAYANYVYAGINAIEPGAADHLFTKAFVERQKLGDAINACFYAEVSLNSDLVAANGLTSILVNATEFPTDPALRALQTKYGAGTGKPSQVPLLVVQSTGDQTIPYPVVELAYRTTCKAGGQPLQLSLYTNLDHSPSLGASAPEWLQFIQDRFNGVPWVSSCTVVHHKALDVAAAYLPFDF